MSRQLFHSENSLFERFRAIALPGLGLGSLILTALSLLVLLGSIFFSGWEMLNFKFLTNFPSRFPEKAGVYSALVGSFWLIGLTALISVPLGLSSAIYLEEFAKKNWLTSFIRLNISNLAAVPSIIYGLLGLAVFVRWMALERSVLAGALTMSLLVLPVIIIASMEALRAVPQSIRDAAYGVGATRVQTVFHHVVPEAIGGMLTGVILSVSRAFGETAPLIVVGALAYAAFLPEGPLDQFTTLSIQVFNWASRPQAEFHQLASSAIIVLLCFSLGLQALAVFIRFRFLRRKGLS